MKIIQVVKSIGRYQWFLIAFLSAYNFVQAANYGILIFAPDVKFQCTDFNSTESQCSTNIAVDLENTFLDNTTSDNVKCHNFEYDHSQFEWTLTERFDLVCGRKFIISILKSTYVVGYFIGALGSGIFADKFGRKTTALITSFIGAICCVTQAVVADVWTFVVFRLVQATVDCACYVSLFILVTESIRKEQRIVVKLFDSTFYGIASVAFGALSFVITNYVYFYMIFAMLFVVIFFVVFFCLFESPRWLSAKRKETEAMEVVAKISKINKIEAAEDSNFLLQSVEQSKKGNFLSLFRTPLIRKRTFILCTIWFAFVFGYFAIMLNLGSFTTDVRLSLFISSCIEVPSVLPMALLMKKLGRRMVLFIVLILSALCCLGMAPFVEIPSHPALISLAVAGKLLLANTFLIMYVYTPELYPTIIRASGLGLCSTSSRVVAALAPQLVLLTAYWPPVMVVTIGLLLLLVAFLVPMLPDMTGVEMPQTIDDGENLFRNGRYGLGKARVK